MFSLSAKLPVAPSVTVDSSPVKKERVYHPRTYSDFVKGLKNNELPQVVIKPNQNLAIYDDDEGNYGDTRIVQTEQLWQTLTDSEANVMIDMTAPTTITDYLSTFFMFSLAFFLFRGIFSGGGGGAGPMGNPFLKNKEFRAEEDIETRFSDVEGIDAAKDELEEIVDFLKKPERYFGSGARIPRGALLAGKPGTGKTLLARAIAGESNVPFIQCSAANFIEMFVGVGAKRVRDLFEVARENQPCIVFIDEIDAVGRQRGAGLGGGNDEREQTLNQLLVEMDGFGTNSGIIVIAATNRPDVLDPALMRPGRFDRQITINNPDVRGREAILKVHSRNKKIVKGVTLDEIARRTPGFSGADLENLMNESALLAARDNRKAITLEDIDEAADRVMMGPAKKSKKYTPKERERVAYHEAGHAVIGLKLDNASVVHKVTIVPRGQAGGYNLMLPDEETFLETKSSLEDKISGLMGGRVAEEIIYQDVSTGAHNDFQRATQIARAMVTEYGMSSLGPIQYERSTGPVFLGRDYTKSKDFSDKVAFDIDNAVKEIINNCYQRSTDVINEHRVLLDTITDYLLEIETLKREDIEEIHKTGKLQWWEDKKAQNTAEPVIGDAKENVA